MLLSKEELAEALSLANEASQIFNDMAFPPEHMVTRVKVARALLRLHTRSGFAKAWKRAAKENRGRWHVAVGFLSACRRELASIRAENAALKAKIESLEDTLSRIVPSCPAE